MAEHAPVAAITGAAGYIGTRLLYKLEEQEELPRVAAIDTNSLPLPVRNVISVRQDVTDSLDQTLRDMKINTVVHLAFNFGPGRDVQETRAIREANLKGMANVLHACQAAKVTNLIYLSTHTVYGAYKDNPMPITEEAPMRPLPGFQYSQDKGLCESMIREFSKENPSIEVTVLRSCVVLGPAADNFVTRSFFQPVFLGISGCNPPFQFVHEDDLAKLLCLLIKEPRPGVFNVAGERVVHYRKMAVLAERNLITLPSAIAYPLTQLSWRLGIQKSSPAVGLNFICYPMVVSIGKLKKETGFRFRYTSEEALMAYLMGRSG